MRNGSLRRVLAAFFLFNTQEYAVWIAVTIYAFERGGAGAAGAVLVAQLIPAALVAPFTSTLGDRLPRGTALVLGYAIQATMCLLLALALWKAPAIVAYAVAVVANCAITFTRPVHNAMLPGLSDTPGELTAANAATGMMDGLGALVGPAVNAVLIGPVGPAGVVVAMAVPMASAALLSLHLPQRHDPHPDEVDGGRSFISDAFAGLRELRADPGAALLVAVGGSQFFLIGLLDVFFVLLAIEVLRVGSSGAGVLAAGYGVGGLIGGIGAIALIGRRRLSAAMVGGLVACGATLAAVGTAGDLAGAVLLLAACGAARTFFDIVTRTLLQRAVKDDVLARVFGIDEALQMFGLAAGAAAAPVLVSMFGARGAFAAAGVLLVVIGVGTWPRLRRVDEYARVPGPELDLLRSISIFAPLPEHVAEHLSWNLIPVEVAAGTVVIREGDEGDLFYVLSNGEVEVITGGRSIARLGPGDYFGEIALLRDVPRTATVTAITDCRLLSLTRSMFLGGVTGSVRTLEAAHTEIDRRLRDHEDG